EGVVPGPPEVSGTAARRDAVRAVQASPQRRARRDRVQVRRARGLERRPAAALDVRKIAEPIQGEEHDLRLVLENQGLQWVGGHGGLRGAGLTPAPDAPGRNGERAPGI